MESFSFGQVKLRYCEPQNLRKILPMVLTSLSNDLKRTVAYTFSEENVLI